MTTIAEALVHRPTLGRLAAERGIEMGIALAGVAAVYGIGIAAMALYDRMKATPPLRPAKPAAARQPHPERDLDDDISIPPVNGQRPPYMNGAAA